MINSVYRSARSSFYHIRAAGAQWFKMHGLNLFTMLILGFILSMSFQWILGTALAAQWFSPIQSLLGSIMQIEEVLANPYFQIGVSVVAIRISSGIVNSQRFQSLRDKTWRMVKNLWEGNTDNLFSMTNTLEPNSNVEKIEVDANAQEENINVPDLENAEEPDSFHLGRVNPPELPDLQKTNSLFNYPKFVFPGFQNAEPRSFFSTLAILFKTIVAAALPPRQFVKVARLLPIGGWIEYAPYIDIDDLHYAASCGSLEDLENLISVIPQDALHRILQRRDDEGNDTALYSASVNLRNPDLARAKFKALLNAIAKEQRLTFLTAISGDYDVIDPVVFHLDLYDGYWDIIADSLSFEDQRKLAKHKNLRGDSLLQEMVRRHGSLSMRKILQPFSKEEQIAYLKEICPHGKNPVVELFYRSTFKRLKKRTLPLFEKEDWQELFDCKPTNWTMTIGQKIYMLISADKDSCRETSSYLKREYNIRVPEQYRERLEEMVALRRAGEYVPTEYLNILKEIEKGLKYANCETRENFKKKYGSCPEEMLGAELNLELAAYTPAYRRLQLQYHPDRNPEGESMTLALNAAKEFIRDPKVRKSYRTPSPYHGRVGMVNDPSVPGGMKIAVLSK